MCRDGEFPTINPFLPRSHIALYFEREILIYFFLVFSKCSGVTTSKYFTLSFLKENIIPVVTYLFPRIYPLSQEFHCHLRCYGASCSGPVLYHITGYQQKWEPMSTHLPHRYQSGTRRCWLCPVRPESKKKELNICGLWWEGQAHLGNAMP